MSTSAPDDQAAGQAGSDTGPDAVDPQVLLHDLANSTALLPQEAVPEGDEPPEVVRALPGFVHRAGEADAAAEPGEARQAGAEDTPSD